MNIIIISIVISMVGILATGGLNTNLVFAQYPNGYGGGCGTGGCSPSTGIENGGSGITGGSAGGGSIPGESPSGIYGSGSGFGGQGYPKFASPCGIGGGGAYDSNTGERIGSGIGGGSSCEPGQWTTI